MWEKAFDLIVIAVVWFGAGAITAIAFGALAGFGSGDRPMPHEDRGDS